MPAAIAAPTAHTGRRASSSNCPLGWCGVVLVSGTPRPTIGDAASSSRPARHAAGGECYRQQHCLGGFCAAATRSDRARPGGPSHGLHLRPRPGVLDGLRRAAATQHFCCILAFCGGFVVGDFCDSVCACGGRASSSSHPIGQHGVVLISGNPQPAIGDAASSSRPARHAAGGECHRQ